MLPPLIFRVQRSDPNILNEINFDDSFEDLTRNHDKIVTSMAFGLHNHHSIAVVFLKSPENSRSGTYG